MYDVISNVILKAMQGNTLKKDHIQTEMEFEKKCSG